MAIATFVAASALVSWGTGSGANSRAPLTPAGTASGDTIFFLVEMAFSKRDTLVPTEGQTQVGSWQDGEADANEIPSTSIWRVTHDGVNADWNFQFTTDGNRGGSITAVSYSGDCTVQQYLREKDTSVAGARSGPTITSPSGNRIVAFQGGSGVAATITWNNSFVERTDNEFYGLVTIADIAGDGTAKTPNLTPTIASQSMWHVIDLGLPVDQKIAWVKA